ncbi:MAG: enoyl-CoA hydratase-related protein [Georgenia sp.]
MDDDVLVAVRGGVLTLTLNRPEKKNALTTAMYETLGSAIDGAGRDRDVRCVLLRAAGDAFCAGNDLSDFLALRERPGGWAGNPLLTALARTATPLVAAVQGHAVGIGLTMLLHCDLVYLADDARLSVPFADLGLVPEAASTKTLPDRIGHPRAFEMFVLGEVVDAARAEAWGLANAVVPRDRLDARAREAAEQVAARSARAVAATKSLMRDGDALQRRIDEEGEQFVERLRSAEVGRAIDAFLRGRGEDG